MNKNLKKHIDLIYFGLGLLIVISADKNSGFLFPWYLHLIFGLFLSLYGVYLYIKKRHKKTNKIIVSVLISVSIIISVIKFSGITNPQNNPLNDGNHPFWNASEYSYELESDNITGLIKLNDDKILVQINETNGLAYDSIHILNDERRLTSSNVFMTYLIDGKGIVRRGTTAKKSMIRFKDYFTSLDTLRVGFIYNDEPFKKIKNNIKLEFFKNSELYSITVDIKQ
ncbi:hypothetical protein [Lacinutrix jangbogonensis]|uniref:hypothetical protein n=1 Tax=Lacinutrix jangbogonensis TaxID=1469557 RepID=UPI00053E756E|nr:hypothetical protein [Lacinutrix jangbogonensis]